MKKTDTYYNDLVALFDVLEALFDDEKGCPFDREQNLKSMCKYIVDEVYELIDAIYSEEEAVIEELGDVLFLLSMTLIIYSRESKTLFSKALQCVVEKMKRRHPYVFANEQIPTTREEYSAIWERIKKEEKSQQKKKVFSESIPRSADPFTKAIQIQRKSKYIPDSNTSVAQQIYSIIANANESYVDIIAELEQYNQELLQKFDN